MASPARWNRALSGTAKYRLPSGTLFREDQPTSLFSQHGSVTGRQPTAADTTGCTSFPPHCLTSDLLTSAQYGML